MLISKSLGFMDQTSLFSTSPAMLVHVLILSKGKIGFSPCKNRSLLRTLDYFQINGEHRFWEDKVLL